MEYRVLTIEIVNDGKHERRPLFGSYDYVVRVNQQVVAEGRVENHRRTDRWPWLLMELAKDAERRQFAEAAAELLGQVDDVNSSVKL